MIDKYRAEYEFSVEKKEVPLDVLRKMIEHTNLKPQATPDDIEKLCEEAKKYDFLGVCVNPSYVSLARKSLEGTDIKVVTVIGFPLGATDQRTKALEAKTAIERGADEFDMVI
ncbi:MAG: deoxyribose-phosphate aldolase, partial [Thermotogae bacterium]